MGGSKEGEEAGVGFKVEGNSELKEEERGKKMREGEGKRKGRGG